MVFNIALENQDQINVMTLIIFLQSIIYIFIWMLLPILFHDLVSYYDYLRDLFFQQQFLKSASSTLLVSCVVHLICFTHFMELIHKLITFLEVIWINFYVNSLLWLCDIFNSLHNNNIMILFYIKPPLRSKDCCIDNIILVSVAWIFYFTNTVHFYICIYCLLFSIIIFVVFFIFHLFVRTNWIHYRTTNPMTCLLITSNFFVVD